MPMIRHRLENSSCDVMVTHKLEVRGTDLVWVASWDENGKKYTRDLVCFDTSSLVIPRGSADVPGAIQSPTQLDGIINLVIQ
jgi:hypothetical protein